MKIQNKKDVTETGFAEKDQINQIVVDIGPIDWGKTNPGTAYIVTSWARTIGSLTVDNPYPIDSTLYLECTIDTQRFENVLLKENGEKTVMVENEKDG